MEPAIDVTPEDDEPSAEEPPIDEPATAADASHWTDNDFWAADEKQQREALDVLISVKGYDTGKLGQGKLPKLADMDANWRIKFFRALKEMPDLPAENDDDILF